MTPGTAYTLYVEICDGTCRSKHGHSFGRSSASFTLKLAADAADVVAAAAAAAVETAETAPTKTDKATAMAELLVAIDMDYQPNTNDATDDPATVSATDSATDVTDAATPTLEVTFHPLAAIRARFSKWMLAHGKSYADAEEHDRRMSIYSDNAVFVERHNAEHAEGKHSHWVGLNHLADLTSEEFKHMLGYKRTLMDARPPVDPLTWEYADVAPAPAVDWVKKGAVTPVKNQGQCGSCWAFSTTGAVEGVNAITSGKLTSVSEEELVSCSHNGNMGCSGGLMDNAFKWIISNKGIDTEADWPYTAAKGKCGFMHKRKRAVSIDGFKDVPANNEAALAKAVTMHPVAVAIEADHQSFQLYKGGVYASKDCGTSLDHGVLVVGYGVDHSVKGHKHFWTIKNSWGPAWGEDGYIRMAKGGKAVTEAGQCGVALQPSYPTQSKAAPTSPSLLNKFGDLIADYAAGKVQALATA
jgi:C1A family cysteine protease